MSFVDVAAHPPAPTELRRFADRLGARALLDETGRRYRDLGLGYMRFDDADVLERLIADPLLLRSPLVRLGQRMAAGPDEPAWRAMLAEGAA